MAMYHLRNVVTGAIAYGYAASWVMVLHRFGIFWLGGWSEVTISVDAAWAAPGAGSLLAVEEAGGATGFSVDAAIPNVIHDPSGRFTASMQTYGYFIALKAATASNRGLYKIVRVIDASNVEVDAMSAPTAWTTETQIPAKIIGGTTDGASRFANTRLTSGCSGLFQAPSGNLQIRILDTSNQMYTYARPNGAVAATEVGGDIIIGAGGVSWIIQAVLEDPNMAIVMYPTNSMTSWASEIWGTLTNADAGDSDPNFLLTNTAMETYYPWNGTKFRMLDGSGSPADIACYACYSKRFSDTVPTSSFYALPANRRTRKGQIYLRSAWVVMENTLNVGACVRGRLPLVKFSHSQLELLKPLDAAGAWVHIRYGLVLPRNGVNDHALLGPIV